MPNTNNPREGWEEKEGREGLFLAGPLFIAIVLWDSLLSYKLSILLWPCALSISWSSEGLLGQMGDEWDVRQAQHRVGGGPGSGGRDGGTADSSSMESVKTGA